MPTYSLASSGPLSVALLGVLFLSVWFDVSEQRIPNWITIGGFVGALALRAIVGPEALAVGLLGGALGFFLGILFFAVGALGAGDGKLLATVGTFLGLDVFVGCLPLIGAFGGLLPPAVAWLLVAGVVIR